jgi:methyl-accepting chemotaxis protein
MISIFRNRYKLSLTLATFFILGIAVSLFAIYSLPGDLRLADGYQSQFFSVYIILAITFMLGSISLVSALRYKKEVVVFRDKTIDEAFEKKNEAEQGKTTISLDGVTSEVQQANGTKEIFEAGLKAICRQLEAGQGAVYEARQTDDKRIIELVGGYALSIGESTKISYEFGEGLIGQAAASGQSLYVDDVPEGYIKIVSGLGTASPKFLLIIPILRDGLVSGVMEIASFTPISEDYRRFSEESAELIANRISTNAS